MNKIQEYFVTTFLGLVLMLQTGILSANDMDCGDLTLTYNSQYYKLDVQSCSRGIYSTPEPGYIVMTQNNDYGPDCKIKASFIALPTKFVLFEAQQNFCLLEAGAIHIKPLSANPASLKISYSTKEGSYSSLTPGQINFDGFVTLP